MNLEKTLKRLDQTRDESVSRLSELLKFKSISTNSKYKIDCISTAKWLVNELNTIGFNASLRETTGNPMVVAHTTKSKGDFLFYGHYDVQPVDPLKEWEDDPFEPKIKSISGEKVIVARGASDDKGQLMTFIEACRAINYVNNSFPINLSILLEGEEETSSPSLVPFLKKNTSELKCKYALVCDTGMWDKKTPSITCSLRGMLSEEISIKGPNRDLHSGIYGGVVNNPLKVMSDLLSNLHDKNGKVDIPYFYNGVEAVSKELKKEWKKLSFSEETFLKNLGMSKSFGEKNYSLLERLWGRPTCEINGMWGGYIEEGFKTVIPSEAHAKISFRLVGDQNPEEIRLNFRKKLMNNLPEDFEIKFSNHKGSKATQFPLNDEIINKAQKALSDEWNSKTVFEGGGGSIPIVQHFKNILDMDTLLVGFALDDDNIHSPNEKYNLKSFYKGARSWVRIIDEIAKN